MTATAKQVQRMVQDAIEDGREQGPSILVKGDTVTAMHAGHAFVARVTARTVNYYGDDLWTVEGDTITAVSFCHRTGVATVHSRGYELCKVPADRISRS